MKLTDLPDHVLEMIGSHLYGSDFLNARLACQACCRSLSPVTRTVKVHLHHRRQNCCERVVDIRRAFPKSCRMVLSVDANATPGKVDLKAACLGVFEGIAATLRGSDAYAPPADAAPGAGPSTSKACALGVADSSSSSSPLSPLPWQHLQLKMAATLMPLNKDLGDMYTLALEQGQQRVAAQVCCGLAAGIARLAEARGTAACTLPSLDLSTDDRLPPLVLTPLKRTCMLAPLASQLTELRLAALKGSRRDPACLPVLACMTALRSLTLAAGLHAGLPACLTALSLLTALELQHSGKTLVGAELQPLVGLQHLVQLRLKYLYAVEPMLLAKLSQLTSLDLTMHASPVHEDDHDGLVFAAEPLEALEGSDSSEDEREQAVADMLAQHAHVHAHAPHHAHMGEAQPGHGGAAAAAAGGAGPSGLLAQVPQEGSAGRSISELMILHVRRTAQHFAHFHAAPQQLEQVQQILHSLDELEAGLDGPPEMEQLLQAQEYMHMLNALMAQQMPQQQMQQVAAQQMQLLQQLSQQHVLQLRQLSLQHVLQLQQAALQHLHEFRGPAAHLQEQAQQQQQHLQGELPPRAAHPMQALEAMLQLHQHAAPAQQQQALHQLHHSMQQHEGPWRAQQQPRNQDQPMGGDGGEEPSTEGGSSDGSGSSSDSMLSASSHDNTSDISDSANDMDVDAAGPSTTTAPLAFMDAPNGAVDDTGEGLKSRASRALLQQQGPGLLTPANLEAPVPTGSAGAAGTAGAGPSTSGVGSDSQPPATAWPPAPHAPHPMLVPAVGLSQLQDALSSLQGLPDLPGVNAPQPGPQGMPAVLHAAPGPAAAAAFAGAGPPGVPWAAHHLLAAQLSGNGNGGGIDGGAFAAGMAAGQPAAGINMSIVFGAGGAPPPAAAFPGPLLAPQLGQPAAPPGMPNHPNHHANGIAGDDDDVDGASSGEAEEEDEELVAAALARDAQASSALWQVLGRLPNLRALNVNAWQEAPLDDERLPLLARLSLPSLGPLPLPGLTSLGLLLQARCTDLSPIAALTLLKELTLVMAPASGPAVQHPPAAPEGLGFGSEEEEDEQEQGPHQGLHGGGAAAAEVMDAGDGSAAPATDAMKAAAAMPTAAAVGVEGSSTDAEAGPAAAGRHGEQASDGGGAPWQAQEQEQGQEQGPCAMEADGDSSGGGMQPVAGALGGSGDSLAAAAAAGDGGGAGGAAGADSSTRSQEATAAAAGAAPSSAGGAEADGGPCPMAGLAALVGLEKVRVYDDQGGLRINQTTLELLSPAWPCLRDIYLLGSVSLAGAGAACLLRPSHGALAHLDLFHQDATCPYTLQLDLLPPSLRALGVQNVVLEGAGRAGRLQSSLEGLSMYSSVHWRRRANGGQDAYSWIAGCTKLTSFTVEYDMRTYLRVVPKSAPTTPLAMLARLPHLATLGVFFADSNQSQMAGALDTRLLQDIAGATRLEELELWNVYGTDWCPSADWTLLARLRRLRALKVEALPPRVAWGLRALMAAAVPYCRVRLVADNEFPSSTPLEATGLMPLLGPTPAQAMLEQHFGSKPAELDAPWLDLLLGRAAARTGATAAEPASMDVGDGAGPSGSDGAPTAQQREAQRRCLEHAADAQDAAWELAMAMASMHAIRRQGEAEAAMGRWGAPSAAAQHPPGLPPAPPPAGH